MIIHNKISSEIATEILNFLMAFSEISKKQGLRKHHLTIGHAAVVVAIHSVLPDGNPLGEYTVKQIARAVFEMGMKDKYSSVKKNLEELVRLGFVRRDGEMYSYSLHIVREDKNNTFVEA